MADYREVILLQAAGRTTPTCSPEPTVWGVDLDLFVACIAVIVGFIAAIGQVWSARAARRSNLAQRSIAELNAVFELNKQYSFIVFDLKKNLKIAHKT